MLVFISHFILAILLFYIVNWIGNHSFSLGYIQLSIFNQTDESPAFNFILRFGSPIVFIIIVSGVFYSLGWDWLVTDIYHVVIIYFVFRVLHNLISERFLLINWPYNIFIILSSTLSSYYLYRKLIVVKTNLLPDFSNLANELWVIILIFLYTILNKVQISSENADARKAKYIKANFMKFKERYGKIIEKMTADADIQLLIYSILIYEAFNRPKYARMIESLVFPLELSKTLGLMQVTTEKYITDEESVRLGAQMIIDSHQKHLDESKILNAEIIKEWEKAGEKFDDPEILYKTILDYNPSERYVEEIMTLRNELTELSVEH